MTSLISADNTWALWAILTGIAALAIYLEQRYAWAGKVTGCVIALIAAMILSNTRVIPLDSPVYDNVWTYVVPLAIPLLLFNANVKKIWKESGRMLGIYLLSGLGTIVGGIVAFFLLRNFIPELARITPMMVGTYTGGSVNLVAMADAFATSGEMVSSSVVADNLLMALYFFVLVAIPSINFFFKKYKHPIIDEQLAGTKTDGEAKTRAASYWAAKPISLKHIAMAVAIAFIIVAVSVAISNVFAAIIPTSNFFFSLINGLLGSKYLIMTTLTMLLATYLPNFMGNIAGAQEIGTFLIHIFFTVIGVPASIYMIVTKAPLLLVFCLIIVLFNMLFSFGFGKLLKSDLETIILASNANIGGPTTAAAFAVSKGWDALIIPSILVGVLGYVIGNYYGIFVGTFLGGL